MFQPGLDITPLADPLGFTYGKDCFGPVPEMRHLDAIRPSLRDPHCTGPDKVYAIAMDVGRPQDRQDLHQRNLLFGVVSYAAGRLGDEPVRSQGHVHKPSPHNGWSTPEVYEIWQGRAIILMQESDQDDPGRCFAVEAQVGQVVIVPPGWAHATISADIATPLTFGAWCDRDYGFIYDGVRRHGGLAWFPLLDDRGNIHWQSNSAYHHRPLVQKKPQSYDALNLHHDVAIYKQYQQDHERFMFVPEPQRVKDVWNNFVP